MKKTFNKWPPEEVDITWEYDEKEFKDSIEIKLIPGDKNYTKSEGRDR